MDIKLSQEVQELVDNRMLDADEAALIQAIRDKKIENPLKEETNVEVSTDTTSVKELDYIIEESKQCVETSKNLIAKVSKAIDMIEKPQQLLFENEDLLSTEDKKKLSMLNKELQESLHKTITNLEEQIQEALKTKDIVEKYSNNVENLFSESFEVNQKIANDFNEKQDQEQQQKISELKPK